MTMRDDTIIYQIREAERLEPNPALRARVLAAARPRVRPSATWADRMWFSRAWRLAAMTIVLVLVAIELMPSPARDRAVGPSTYAVAAAASTEEAALQMGMKPEEAKALGRRAMADAMSQPSGAHGAEAGAIPPDVEGETR